MEDVAEEGLGTEPSPCFQENPQESRRVYKTFDGCERVGVGEESHSDRQRFLNLHRKLLCRLLTLIRKRSEMGVGEI